MIQPYVIIFHPNSKHLPCNTKSCVGVSVAYLPKSYIPNYYHGVGVFEKLKYQSCDAQNRSSSEMSNSLFETYNIISCHMVIIYFKHNMTCRC